LAGEKYELTPPPGGVSHWQIKGWWVVGILVPKRAAGIEEKDLLWKPSTNMG
jgi:hypothetical protein